METTIDRSKIKITGNCMCEPQQCAFDIAVHATIEIDTLSARRKVTGWLIDEVGNMIIGGMPQLIVSKQTIWRVSAILTSTRKGVIGEVGTVDVDAETGELKTSAELREQILNNVTHIVKPLSSIFNQRHDA